MLFPALGTLLMLACAVFFYKVGEIEYSSGVPLAAASLGLWNVAGHFFRWGVLGCLLLQAGLFGALTGLNILRNKPIA